MIENSKKDVLAVSVGQQADRSPLSVLWSVSVSTRAQPSVPFPPYQSLSNTLLLSGCSLIGTVNTLHPFFASASDVAVQTNKFRMTLGGDNCYLGTDLRV